MPLKYKLDVLYLLISHLPIFSKKGWCPTTTDYSSFFVSTDRSWSNEMEQDHFLETPFLLNKLKHRVESLTIKVMVAS